MSEVCTLALRIAKKAHYGQVDKGGMEYIQHPIYVANQVDTEEEKAVALLHDVIETSNYKIDDLRKSGLPESVVQAVEVLTKKPWMGEEEYLALIKQNQLARIVKLAELKHNSDLSRIPEIGLADFERVETYKKAIAYLSQ
ncbi:GTP pyrophosphokinase [uncultured Vagococcus sp.]|uniref:GTP pyrophosphokinase n=1 Tax=uncultured Vagococcus sp. TaxID=189676 RepID=UPI0028D2041A|nr:GTP pyrophosphokinase [uncultured Vagococcus sp.]